MHGEQQSCCSMFCTISRTATAALAVAVVFMLTVVASQAAQAQTFTVLHNFTGGTDGGRHHAGVTLDKAGNLYGTTFAYGADYGTVYQLKRKEGRS